MENLLPWLTLYHAPNLSSRAARHCISHFGSATAVCSADAAALADIGLDEKTIRFFHTPNSNALQRDLDWAEQPSHHLLLYDDAAYPSKLREISDAPLLLFGIGNISLLNEPQIAVVGSRRPTSSGLRNARMFCEALANTGFIITSGLAAGVDSCAHTTALELAAPTIAVIGTGIDVTYPAKNKNLAQSIAEKGVIISEFSCGTPAYANNFPRRNRLMSGLSAGVLVVEATEKSGSLITARLAAEQGREVFALPGSIHNPLTRGCHCLIQNGAKLVQTIDDILLELADSVEIYDNMYTSSDKNSALVSADKISSAQRQLLEQMEMDEPITIDELAEHCQLPVPEIASMLLILELEGYVSMENHIYVRLI